MDVIWRLIFLLSDFNENIAHFPSVRYLHCG